MPRGAKINVEVKVMGLVAGDYISVVADLSLPKGATMKDLLKALEKEEKMDKTTFRAIKDLKPPVTLLINGENNASRKSAKLEDNDTISIFTPISGG